MCLALPCKHCVCHLPCTLFILHNAPKSTSLYACAFYIVLSSCYTARSKTLQWESSHGVELQFRHYEMATGYSVANPSARLLTITIHTYSTSIYVYTILRIILESPHLFHHKGSGVCRWTCVLRSCPSSALLVHMCHGAVMSSQGCMCMQAHLHRISQIREDGPLSYSEVLPEICSHS